MGPWAKVPTGEVEDALPFVWTELTPNVENPVVIESTDKSKFLMVFDALSQNESCKMDPQCGWVQGQCWSNTACNSVGIAWSEDGVDWSAPAAHVQVQVPAQGQESSGAGAGAGPDSQCGLIRTPLGLVPEPTKCAGCYSLLWTGWAAPEEEPHEQLERLREGNGTNEGQLQGHALPRSQCPPGQQRCQVYQGFKPICAALIQDAAEAEAIMQAREEAAAQKKAWPHGSRRDLS
eukprot:g1402.t1